MAESGKKSTPGHNTTSSNNSDKDLLWGWPIKRWTTIFVWATIIILSVFLIIPFILSLVVPLIWPDKLFTHLPDALDGMSLVLGLMGTVASIVSIAMTIADQKRYRSEQTETEKLMRAVAKLHKEISVVDEYVKKTFETNNNLALQLYKSNIVAQNPAAPAVGVETKTDAAQWGDKAEAKEIPLDSVPQTPKETQN